MKAVGRTSVGTSPFCNSPGWLRQVSGVGVSVMLGRVGRGGTRVFVAVGGRDVAGNVPAFEFLGSALGTFRVNVTVSDGSSAVWQEWTVTVVPREPFPMWIVWLTLILAVAVIASVVFLWRMRGKGDQGPPPTSGTP